MVHACNYQGVYNSVLSIYNIYTLVTVLLKYRSKYKLDYKLLFILIQQDLFRKMDGAILIIAILNVGWFLSLLLFCTFLAWRADIN